MGLAAIRAAITGEERASLEWAYELAKEKGSDRMMRLSLDWLPAGVSCTFLKTLQRHSVSEKCG
jgi:hypothetical protein